MTPIDVFVVAFSLWPPSGVGCTPPGVIDDQVETWMLVEAEGSNPPDPDFGRVTVFAPTYLCPWGTPGGYTEVRVTLKDAQGTTLAVSAYHRVNVSYLPPFGDPDSAIFWSQYEFISVEEPDQQGELPRDAFCNARWVVASTRTVDAAGIEVHSERLLADREAAWSDTVRCD